MKKLLTLLILAPMVAGAQMYYFEVDTIPIGKIDTVAVRMMISDNRVGEGYVPAFVVRGFEVNIRRPFINEPGTSCWNCPNYWEHVIYLDYQKKPLGKHIEVWTVKPK